MSLVSDASSERPADASDVGGLVSALKDITDARAGGKAYGLARLAALGLPVPPAFVVCEASGKVFPEKLVLKKIKNLQFIKR